MITILHEYAAGNIMTNTYNKHKQIPFPVVQQVIQLTTVDLKETNVHQQG